VITGGILATESVRIVVISSALQPPDWRTLAVTWRAGV